MNQTNRGSSSGSEPHDAPQGAKSLSPADSNSANGQDTKEVIDAGLRSLDHCTSPWNMISHVQSWPLAGVLPARFLITWLCTCVVAVPAMEAAKRNPIYLHFLVCDLHLLTCLAT